ncbi:hypothetical protein [Streptomyces chilikensis]|uniref:hypothetical protein n=1 Tax=Streptomyces chilikensis TaxID=1194079 RepID=UPI000A75DBFB|nr:hypothetical protein [Streptomyces chilikensis]
MSLGDDYGDGQTRTRMPERDELPPRRGRGGGRSSRGLVTAVGVIVLLIAAIAFANRDNEGTRDADKSSAAAPTAPTGERPVSSGFAHDEQGAQSAAANYAVALGSAEMFDKGRRDAIVDAVYASEVAAERRADLDRAYANPDFLANIGLEKDGSAPSGQSFVSRIIPVGTKVTEYGADKATVEVWYTSLFGLSGDNSTNPVTESWYTTTYELSWTRGDWKVTDFQQKDGPVPVGRDQRASTSEDMTKAVSEYGGFTYAR